jgi:capsular exopolysaccharide synthesis family protein
VALNAQLQALYQAVATREAQPADQLNLVQPSLAQPTPVAPTPKRDAALGFITALVIDAELAVGWELLGDRLPVDRAEEEVTRLTGLPVLAQIPEGGGEEVVEAFRTLRTSMLFLESAGNQRTVAIASFEPAAGKSFVATNLALSFAELEVNVTLVDGDMRRPTVHERLGLSRSPGLAEVLSGGSDLADAIQLSGSRPQLQVLSAGQPASDPPGLITGGLVPRVFKPLAGATGPTADLVIVDTPAEHVFPDALTIAVHCDSTLLVVDVRRGRKRAVRSTINRLRQINVNLVGVVLNRAQPDQTPRQYRYRYQSR